MRIDDKVARLRDPGIYPDRPAAVEVIETHFSWVFLTPSRVYKLKKPVRYHGLDFTTLAARRHNCEQEVALNRRLAPPSISVSPRSREPLQAAWNSTARARCSTGWW